MYYEAEEFYNSKKGLGGNSFHPILNRILDSYFTSYTLHCIILKSTSVDQYDKTRCSRVMQQWHTPLGLLSNSPVLATQDLTGMKSDCFVMGRLSSFVIVDYVHVGFKTKSLRSRRGKILVYDRDL